jgi:protein-S-isoprenylcysteine O-methyltransferase Ste14
MVSSFVQSWERYLPLSLGILFIGCLFGYRALRFSRIYGFSPILIPRAGGGAGQAFLSSAVPVGFLVVLGLGALAAFWPQQLERIDPLYGQRLPVLTLPGVSLILLGGWLVWRGQEDMAGSWRIGIPADERTELVTHGVFSFCRNPIYLGLLSALAGFCCLIPGYLTLGLLVLAILLMQVQARLEEEHLLRQHGAAYAAYCARVGRFLPFTGRRPTPRDEEHDGQPS